MRCPAMVTSAAHETRQLRNDLLPCNAVASCQSDTKTVQHMALYPVPNVLLRLPVAVKIEELSKQLLGVISRHLVPITAP